MNSSAALALQAEPGPHPAVWSCTQANIILGNLLPLIMQQILVLGDRTLSLVVANTRRTDWRGARY